MKEPWFIHKISIKTLAESKVFNEICYEVAHKLICNSYQNAITNFTEKLHIVQLLFENSLDSNSTNELFIFNTNTTPMKKI